MLHGVVGARQILSFFVLGDTKGDTKRVNYANNFITKEAAAAAGRFCSLPWALGDLLSLSATPPPPPKWNQAARTLSWLPPFVSRRLPGVISYLKQKKPFFSVLCNGWSHKDEIKLHTPALLSKFSAKMSTWAQLHTVGALFTPF